ncbi:hypothetical protein PIB30_115284, partial [Stylosanthes scabra]|nr:hypothetical protein [Stylosanthes scabra]
MFVEEWGKTSGDSVSTKLKNMKPILKEWNKIKFGNIDGRIKELETEIEKADINLENEVNVEENA